MLILLQEQNEHPRRKTVFIKNLKSKRNVEGSELKQEEGFKLESEQGGSEASQPLKKEAEDGDVKEETKEIEETKGIYIDANSDPNR